MKKEIRRTLTVYKNVFSEIVIKLVKPGGGFCRGKEIDYLILTKEEAEKLASQLLGKDNE